MTYVGVPVEVATRSIASATPTYAHTSVADAYKDEQYCMDHNSRIPEPNTGEMQFMGHYLNSAQLNSLLKCTMPHGGTRTQCGPMKHYTQQTPKIC